MVESGLTHPILGIDVGTSSSKIAYIKPQGTTVEIVQNEVNNRTSPSVVGFTKRQRLEADGAQSLIKSNLRNTVRYFKHVLCKKFSDPEIENEQWWALAGLTQGKNGDCAYEVDYLDEQKTYSVSDWDPNSVPMKPERATA